MLNAETITNQQLIDLRDKLSDEVAGLEAQLQRTRTFLIDAELALGYSASDGSDAWRKNFRQKCADLINSGAIVRNK